MTPLRFAFLSILAAVTLTSAPAWAGPTIAEDDNFSWAVVTQGGRAITGNVVQGDPISKLKDRYHRDFLYIRDHDERYVITDPELIDEAREAGSHINRYSKEIGELAQAEARLAMSRVADERRPGLDRRRRALERAIEVRERQGESTDDLEDELFRVRVETKSLESMSRSNQLTSDEREDLVQRRDRASARVQEGERKIQAELRQILADAKERGIAARVDDR